MMVSLYLQNGLYPELTDKTLPNPISTNYSDFLTELRKLTLTSDAVAKLADKYSTTLADAELAYFMPVSMALALERAGLFTLALDWYRKVFDPRQMEAIELRWISYVVRQTLRPRRSSNTAGPSILTIDADSG